MMKMGGLFSDVEPFFDKNAPRRSLQRQQVAEIEKQARFGSRRLFRIIRHRPTPGVVASSISSLRAPAGSSPN